MFWGPTKGTPSQGDRSDEAPRKVENQVIKFQTHQAMASQSCGGQHFYLLRLQKTAFSSNNRLHGIK